jgi:hypothetical protein
MNEMKNLAVVLALVVVGFGPAIWGLADDTPDPPRKAAVLVSAEYADSGLLYNAEFWYDTVLTYCALRQNGFADEDIYVLYGEGEDGFYLPDGDTQPAGASAFTTSDTSKHYYMPPYCADAVGAGTAAPITDFPMIYPATGTGKNGTASRPRDLLECLANGCATATSEYGTIEPLEKRDFLYVWWKGHGITSTSDPRSVSFRLPRLTSVTAGEVVGWLAKVRAGRRVLVLETCHSGCIGNTINTVDPPGILLASAECEETSNNSYEPVGDVPHGVWTYWIDCSLQGQMPNPPPDNRVKLPDGTTMLVGLSLGDPLDQVFDQSATLVNKFATQTPLKKDECELAPHTTIDDADPVGQTPVPCPPP